MLRNKMMGINLTENASRPSGVENIINMLNAANCGYLVPEGLPLTNMDPIVTLVVPTAELDIVRAYRSVRPRQNNFTTALKL